MVRFAAALDADKFAAIVADAIERAINGDGHAREWIAKYALGPAGKFTLMDALMPEEELTPRERLQRLSAHLDPNIALRACIALQEQDQHDDAMAKWLQAVDVASRIVDMPAADGPNPWQPVGED